MAPLYLLLMLCIISTPSLSAAFVVQIYDDPQHLDPVKIRHTSGAYIFNNLYHGLFKYTNKKGLQPLGATKCTYKSSVKILCKLNPRFKFNDGTPVKAINYVWSFQRLFNAQSKTSLVELALPLKGAKKILAQKAPLSALGVKALSDHLLQFQLQAPHSEFLYNLIHPTLSPIAKKNPEYSSAKTIKSTGPFQLKQYKANSFVELEPNPHYLYPTKGTLKFLFLSEDVTALNLYDSGQLDMATNINVKDIPRFKNHNSFIQTPMLRFDYVGFGKRLQKYPKLRKAMAHALEFEQLSKLYHALGVPGCPPLPKNYFTQRPCYKFNQLSFEGIKIPDEFTKQPMIFVYSDRGGESVQQGVEWMQESWRKHLGLNIRLMPLESGMFVHRLRNSNPDLIKKGVGLDRPTCLAALEVFRSQSRENYIHYNNTKFNRLLDKMQRGFRNKKSLCTQATQILLNDYVMIPQGEMHFSMLIRNSYKGWNLNRLNQLDLSRIQPPASK